MFSRTPANPSRRPGAVLLDAMGTLVTFAPPAPRLAAGLRAALGVAVTEADAARAVRAEIAYYRAHLHEGRDAAGLARVRVACARVVRDELGLDAPPEALVAALLESIRFEAYPDAAPALRALRAAGWRLVAASNWDVSLHEALERTGLAALLDGAVASAEIGAAKPGGAIFEHALALAGVEAPAAWHAGDSVAEDVEGARRAGVRPVLVDREGTGGAPAGVPVIRSLAELPALVGAPGP